MSARWALLPLALLAACDVTVRNRPERRYVGALTTSDNAAQCPPSRATLSLRDGRVTFAPDEGTWILSGTAGPDTMQATKSRPTPDRKLYQTELQARWTDTFVRGTYTTPQCSYRVDLTPL